MFKAFILGGTALATLATPVVADAQYYGYKNGYSYRHRHHHENNAGAAIAGALVGGVLGYALANSHGYGYNQRSYGYSYPSYGYGNYGYGPSYGYSYPNYGYGYTDQGYGYNRGYAYRHGDDDDDRD